MALKPVCEAVFVQRRGRAALNKAKLFACAIGALRPPVRGPEGPGHGILGLIDNYFPSRQKSGSETTVLAAGKPVLKVQSTSDVSDVGPGALVASVIFLFFNIRRRLTGDRRASPQTPRASSLMLIYVFMRVGVGNPIFYDVTRTVNGTGHIH